jgi:hypothetical protein
VVALWHREGMVIVNGGILQDVFGNVIIGDRGYDGSGPAAEAATATTGWAYATGAIELYRTTVGVLEGWDRDTNSHKVIASRYYGISWDKDCWYGQRVDLCDLACSELGS